MLGAKFSKNRSFASNAYGDKIWLINGKLHRENGPAFEGSKGTKRWYLNDKSYTEAEYNAELINRGIKNNA